MIPSLFTFSLKRPIIDTRIYTPPMKAIHCQLIIFYIILSPVYTQRFITLEKGQKTSERNFKRTIV